MEPLKISMRGLAEVACAKPSQKQSKMKLFKLPSAVVVHWVSEARPRRTPWNDESVALKIRATPYTHCDRKAKWKSLSTGNDHEPRTNLGSGPNDAARCSIAAHCGDRQASLRLLHGAPTCHHGRRSLLGMEIVPSRPASLDSRSPTTKVANAATQFPLSTPSHAAPHPNRLKTQLQNRPPSLPIIYLFRRILIP